MSLSLFMSISDPSLEYSEGVKWAHWSTRKGVEYSYGETEDEGVDDPDQVEH